MANTEPPVGIQPPLHLLCYHSCLIGTQVCILLFQSPSFCSNTCIHQTPPPLHGTVVCRNVQVHPLSFLSHKYMSNRLSFSVEILLLSEIITIAIILQ